MATSAAEKSARYRAKDVDAYRKKKADYARTPEQKAKRTEYMRGWREKNREKHNRLSRESQKRNRHKYVEKIGDYHLRRKYGLSLDEKRAMVAAQNGKCLICAKEFKNSRSTHVDHCHQTGRIRGILCNVCNTKLGWYEMFSEAISTYLHED